MSRKNAKHLVNNDIMGISTKIKNFRKPNKNKLKTKAYKPK